MIGSLGAASLGPALIEGFEYGSVAPRHDHGIAFQDGRCFIVSGLGSDNLSSVDIAAWPHPLPEGVVWSADGSSAILYSQTGNWLQTLRGLPDSATAGPFQDVSLLGGTLSAVAANGRGDSVAIGLAGKAAGVYQLVRGHYFIPLLSMEHPSSLSFSDDGGTLYVLDRAAGRLAALRVKEFTSVAWQLDDLEDPIAVAAARDADGEPVIYVAGGKDQLLLAYDPATHRVRSSTRINARPTTIQMLGQRSFLLSTRAAEQDPLWSFTNERDLAVFFIPAAPLASKENPGE